MLLQCCRCYHIAANIEIYSSFNENARDIYCDDSIILDECSAKIILR